MYMCVRMYACIIFTNYSHNEIVLAKPTPHGQPCLNERQRPHSRVVAGKRFHDYCFLFFTKITMNADVLRPCRLLVL